MMCVCGGGEDKEVRMERADLEDTSSASVCVKYEGCPKSIRPWAIKAKIIDQSANNFCGSYLHPSCECEQNFRPVTLLVASLEYWNWNGVELRRRCSYHYLSLHLKYFPFNFFSFSFL